MNAVEHMARQLPSATVRRLAALRVNRFAAQHTQLAASISASAEPARVTAARDTDEAQACVVGRWAADLCGFLNALTRGELGALATAMNLDSAGKSPELRARLWEVGAQLERGDAAFPDAPLAAAAEASGHDEAAGLSITRALQPRPIVLGGHLVVHAAPRGMFPPSDGWPRPMPAERSAEPPTDEPETVDDLLAAADRAIGVRLGRRGRDKGAWGMRAAALLGVIERGHDEPDWRGDVEVKTVPVTREASGMWRVVEDPAIAMLNETGVAMSKLQRTLWLVRADVGDGDATIVSWYLLEADAEVARLVRRYLHDRPKGPAGTDRRGLYLHKRFFVDAGLLATLNGT